LSSSHVYRATKPPLFLKIKPLLQFDLPDDMRGFRARERRTE
jgi:hypothetical protein